MGHPKGRKTIVVLLFKDYKDEIQGLDLFSRSFKALQMRKKYKQALSRICRNPANQRKQTTN